MINIFTFVCTSWNGLNFAVLTSRVLAQSAPIWFAKFKLLMLLIPACTSEQKEEEKKTNIKSLAKRFYFSLIRNNILHEYKYNGRYFGLYKNVQRFEEKNRMYDVCCICIYQYLLKYVILIILLTIKGFLNKILFTCFWKTVEVVGVGSLCLLIPESV